VADSPDLGCWATLGYDNGCWVTLGYDDSCWVTPGYDNGCWVTPGYDNGCWVTLVLGLVTQPIKFYLLVLNMDEIISHSENLMFVSAGAEISKRIVI